MPGSKKHDGKKISRDMFKLKGYTKKSGKTEEPIKYSVEPETEDSDDIPTYRPETPPNAIDPDLPKIKKDDGNYFNSLVQLGHLVAFSFISLKQYAHVFIFALIFFSSLISSLVCNLFICLIIRNITKATIIN
jgi:hypothetical protein